MEFNTDFRRTMIAMAKGRGANWKMKREEMKQGERLARDEFERQIFRMPEEQLRRWVLNSQPEIEPELLESTIEHMKAKLANDPLALLQPIQAENNGGEVQLFRMMTLEFALFIAHLTGAAIYTDEPVCWRQLHEHASAPMHASQHSRLAPITEKLANLTFVIETDPRINLEIRHAGKLGRMRRVFRRIWNEALTLDESADVDEIAQYLATSLENASLKAGIEWDTCAITTSLSARFRQRLEFSAPEDGFSLNSVHRLLITSGRTNYIELVPIALFLALENVEDKGTA